MLVMLGYHARLPGTKGAFLALSQFFTLSGFLITGVLLRNHLGPGRGLRSFWVRRARRLLPAAFVALAGIVLFGATVASHQQAQALPGDVLSAATWTANWRFVFNGQSYVDAFSAPSPVGHFWSLAVEEQFYVVLPIALFFLLRKWRSPRVMAVALAGAALASTAWMIVLYESGASLDRIYYGTDTRVAEFLVGAVLAVVIVRFGFEFSHRTRKMIVVASVVAFAVTLWGWIALPLENGLMWRGGALVFSLLTCCLILAAITGHGPVAGFYSLKPLAWIGALSYGLYLFHWPIFLWLTEDRTGLSLWPLFALRAAVTFAVAFLCYRFIERPFLEGRPFGLRGKAPLAFAAVAAVVVVAAAPLTVNRDAVDPLATLNANTAMPRESSDGVLDLLVIPNDASDPAMRGLQSAARENGSVRLTMAPPFACTGGLTATPAGETCASFARRWPELLASHDPDAVLLYANNWSGEPLAELFGGDARAQTEGVASVMAAGVSLLTSRGAPFIWAMSGMSFVEGIRLSTQPFNQAMGRLVAERTDMRRVVGGHLPDPATVSPEQYVARSASALLEDASLYQRAGGHAKPRVLIVGDSQAISLGYGLDRWTAEHDRALVWNHGVEGCGVTSAGERCADARRVWPEQLREFRPDVVIVVSSLTDIQPRTINGESQSLGDPEYNDSLVKEYEGVVDVLSSTGARVIWVLPPCTAIEETPGRPNPYSTANINRLNEEVLPKMLESRRDRVVPFDLGSVLCPDGKVLRSVDGVGELRPDGVHFSVEGALWFAESYGDRLLSLGGI
jgi:peptidoglycan/LPS O-acetylase OafA/YrhL